MKSKLFVILAVAIASIASAKAQKDPTMDEKYGADPSKRLENIKILNFFEDAYNTKAYDDALKYMHHIIKNCPKASQNIYIRSASVFRSKLDLATTKADRAKYLDSLLWLLDRRIDAFGDDPTRGRAYLLSQKALTYHENNPDPDSSFPLFRSAVKEGGKEVDPNMAAVFFNALTEGYKLDDITAEQYIEDYDLLTATLAIEPTEEDVATIAAIDGMFASSGAASCENIEKIFRPKYDADPSNIDQLKLILALFSRSKCSSDFQLALTEKYYQVEPTPDLAMMLAQIYEGKKEYDKASNYLNIAISGEKDSQKKGKMLLNAGGVALGGGRYREAADYARQALAIDPNSGYAYMVLASAYAGGIGGCSGFDRQAAYWLVVDTYQQARARLDSDPAQQEAASRAINSYAAGFPKTEDTFMRGLAPGQGYTVSCGWVSGRTTVRER